MQLWALNSWPEEVVEHTQTTIEKYQRRWSGYPDHGLHRHLLLCSLFLFYLFVRATRTSLEYFENILAHAPTHKKTLACGGGQGLPSHLTFEKQLRMDGCMVCMHVLRSQGRLFTLWVLFIHLETLTRVSVSIYKVVWHSRATCATNMSCKGINVESNIVFRNLRSMCIWGNQAWYRNRGETSEFVEGMWRWVYCFYEKRQAFGATLLNGFLERNMLTCCWVFESKHWIKKVAPCFSSSIEVACLCLCLSPLY